MSSNEILFQDLLDALLDEDKPFPPRYLYRLSDLDPSELDLLKEIWPKISLRRRQALMEDLDELSLDDHLVSYEAIGRYAITDEDANIRTLAVRLLWEFDGTDLIPIFLRLLESDPDPEVRAAAATALGQYVYFGELEELPLKKLNDIANRLLKAIGEDKADLVRRKALESASFSSLEEIPPLIEEAFSTGDTDWMISAVAAMGHSVDKRWESTVVSMLEAKSPPLRAEAARATGELEIAEATPLLLELLDDSDQEVSQAAIWALSEIGGEGARRALEDLLDKAEDENEIEFLESALENLAFTMGVQSFSLLDFPEDMDDETYERLLEEQLLGLEDDASEDLFDLEEEEAYEDILDFEDEEDDEDLPD